MVIKIYLYFSNRFFHLTPAFQISGQGSCFPFIVAFFSLLFFLNLTSLEERHFSLWNWCCRIHPLHLCKDVGALHQYDSKQFDGKVPVRQELWRMRSTPLLPSLPGLLWPGVVAPDGVLSIGQIELDCVHMLNWIFW